MNKQKIRYIGSLLIVVVLFNMPIAFAQKSRKKDLESGYQKQRNLSQAEYFFTEGMKYYVLENYSKAIDAFQKSVEINPDNSGANFALADALAKSGKHTQAVPFAERAIRLNEGNKYYYLLLAQLYEKDRKFPQAIKVYHDLAKRLPEDPESYLNLINIYTYQDKYEDALKMYEKIEKILGTNEEVIRQKEELLIKLNKTGEAIHEAKKLAEAFPDELRYTIRLAEMYVSSGRLKEALPLLEQTVAADHTNAKARLVLADIYRSTGQLEKADRELEVAFGTPGLEANIKVQVLVNYMKVIKDDKTRLKAFKLADLLIKTHPGEAKGYIVYGDLLAQGEEKEKARNLYIQASKLDNSMFEVWHQIIQLDAHLNQMDSLAKHSEQALELFPNQAIFWFYNGVAHLVKKDYDKAIEALEYSKKLSIDNKELTSQILGYLGDSYYNLGDYAKSDAAYEAALENDPNNVSVLNNYSYYLSLRKEKLDLAKQLAGRLVETHPDNPSYLDTYAWVLYMQKDYKQAKKYLEKAARDSNNGTILEHYGDVLFKLGETEKAMQLWMKAKSAGETSELIDKKIAQKKLYE